MTHTPDDSLRKRAEALVDSIVGPTQSPGAVIEAAIAASLSALRDVQRETAEKCAGICQEEARTDLDKAIPTIGLAGPDWFMRYQARVLAAAIRSQFNPPTPPSSANAEQNKP